MDEMVGNLTILVKQWAKSKKINKTQNKGLNSQTWTLLVIFQLRSLKRLQNLQQIVISDLNNKSIKLLEEDDLKKEIQIKNLINKKREKDQKGQDVYQFDDYQKFQDNFIQKKQNKLLTIGQLLIGFFEYYSNFDYKTKLISLKFGIVSKTFKSMSINIQDPFEQDRNLGKIQNTLECLQKENLFWKDIDVTGKKDKGSYEDNHSLNNKQNSQNENVVSDNSYEDSQERNYNQQQDDYQSDYSDKFCPQTGYQNTGDGERVYQFEGESEDYTACGSDCGQCGRCSQ